MLKFFLSSLTLIFLNSFNVEAQNQAYSFFIAGHTYGKAGVDNDGVHPAFKAKFPYLKGRDEIKFGVFTGDIVKSPSESDWNEVDRDVDSLGLPVYFAAGNHDLQNRTLFESRYGSTYYHFLYESDLFIVLDPTIDGWNINEVQLNFVDSLLDRHKNDVARIFVFFHQLIWIEDTRFSSVKPNSFEGKAPNLNFWTEFEPKFTNLSQEVVMCAGDLGAANWASDFMYANYDNITFIASGMGEGVGDNIVVLNVDENKQVSYDLICLNDAELDCFGDIAQYNLTDIIEDVVNNKNISVYPNPSSTGFITVGLASYANVEIQISNVYGEKLYSEYISNEKEHQVSTSGFSPGFYLLSVIADGKSQIEKIVIR